MVHGLKYMIVAAIGIVEESDVEAGSYQGRTAGGDGLVIKRWRRDGDAGTYGIDDKEDGRDCRHDRHGGF